MGEFDPRLTEQYTEWWREQNERRESGMVRFEGLDFWVDRHVFSPDRRLTNSSSLIARSLPDVGGRRVLDVGTGSGALAVLAALRGAAAVLAVDVDPCAVENARQNVAGHQVDGTVEVVQSDLFENVRSPFDVITANLPIDPHMWEHVTDDVAGLVERFLVGTQEHLSPGGTALLAWASFGDTPAVIANMERQRIPFEHHQEETFGVVWDLFEIRR